MFCLFVRARARRSVPQWGRSGCNRSCRSWLPVRGQIADNTRTALEPTFFGCLSRYSKPPRTQRPEGVVDTTPTSRSVTPDAVNLGKKIPKSIPLHIPETEKLGEKSPTRELSHLPKPEDKPARDTFYPKATGSFTETIRRRRPPDVERLRGFIGK